MVFQMQVLPEPYKNSLLWVFDQPRFYDVRSTEYSGPQNPLMFVPNAIIRTAGFKTLIGIFFVPRKHATEVAPTGQAN